MGISGHARDFAVNRQLQLNVRRWYTVDHLTGAEIARIVGVNERSVARWLKALGVSTEAGEWVTTACSVCHAPVRVTRKRFRTTRHLHCSPACYYARRHNPKYVRWSFGTQLARKVVRTTGFPLLKSHVVHHHDGNNRNNAVENLAVFESQRDHMRFHHTGQPDPIWDGRTVKANGHIT